MSRTTTLIAALEPLALGAPEQLAYLAEQGTPEEVDALAQRFDDAFRQVHPVGQTVLDTALRTLDERLSAMGGPRNAALWTPGGLADGADWVFVRATAVRALALTRTLDAARA